MKNDLLVMEVQEETEEVCFSAAALAKLAQVDMKKEGDPPTGADLDEEVQEYQRKHGGTYAQALAKLAQDPAFLKRWELLFNVETRSSK